MGCARLVTLPDWQGLGLAMILIDKMGAVYKAAGKRLHTYPAHPALIRAFDKSKMWTMTQRPASQPKLVHRDKSSLVGKAHAARPCAVFEYCGPAADRDEVKVLQKQL